MSLDDHDIELHIAIGPRGNLAAFDEQGWSSQHTCLAGPRWIDSSRAGPLGRTSAGLNALIEKRGAGVPRTAAVISECDVTAHVMARGGTPNEDSVYTTPLFLPGRHLRAADGARTMP